jgi:hypothetical protein
MKRNWCGAAFALVAVAVSGCLSSQQPLARTEVDGLTWIRQVVGVADGGLERSEDVTLFLGRGPPVCAMVPHLTATQDGVALTQGPDGGPCEPARWATRPPDSGTTAFEFADTTAKVSAVFEVAPLSGVRMFTPDGGRPRQGGELRFVFDGPHGALGGSFAVVNPDGGWTMIQVQQWTLGPDAGDFAVVLPAGLTSSRMMRGTLDLIAESTATECLGAPTCRSTVLVTQTVELAP